MCDRCDARGAERDPVVLQQWLDQQYAETRDTIRRYGWSIQAVSGDGAAHQPTFAYTVGLSGFDHPELVVFGLEHQHAGRLLNELGERVRAGQRFADGDELEAEATNPVPLRLFALPNSDEVLFTAQSLYGGLECEPIAALQVVFADLDGAFPWEPGYSYPRWMQPMPGTFKA